MCSQLQHFLNQAQLGRSSGHYGKAPKFYFGMRSQPTECHHVVGVVGLHIEKYIHGNFLLANRRIHLKVPSSCNWELELPKSRLAKIDETAYIFDWYNVKCLSTFGAKACQGH